MQKPATRQPRSTLHASRSRSGDREKIPFFALAALASVVTFVVQQRGGALAAGESLPLGARVGNALISYCRYLGKLFWPMDLAVFYPHPGHWPLGKVVLAGGLILGISVLVWVRRRRHPYLLMGWLWYCGTLVPVSQAGPDGRPGDGGSVYLPSVAWGADPRRLGRVRTDPALAVSGAGVVGGGWCGDRPLPGVDAATDWLLEGQ